MTVSPEAIPFSCNHFCYGCDVDSLSGTGTKTRFRQRSTAQHDLEDYQLGAQGAEAIQVVEVRLCIRV